MKKTLKILAGISVLVIVISVCSWWYVGRYPVNSHPLVGVDPVIVNGELYFVLPEGDQYGTEEIIVYPAATPNDNIWLMNYTGSVAGLGKSEKRGGVYPKLKQIKYGQKIDGFKRFCEPLKLNRGVKYTVEVSLSRNRKAHEQFIILNENEVVIPVAFGDIHPKAHIYSVPIKKDGGTILVPYIISVDKNNYKVVTSKSP